MKTLSKKQKRALRAFAKLQDKRREPDRRRDLGRVLPDEHKQAHWGKSLGKRRW